MLRGGDCDGEHLRGDCYDGKGSSMVSTWVCVQYLGSTSGNVFPLNLSNWVGLGPLVVGFSLEIIGVFKWIV